MDLTAGKLLNKNLFSKRSKSVPMKVHMHLTPSGWGFLGLIFCSFLMSVNFSNNLIFAMTFLLVSIAIVGWYYTRINVSRLRLSDWKCGHVFAGQNIIYKITVKNPEKITCIGLQAASSESVGSKEIHIKGMDQIDMTLKRKTESRGIVKSVPANIESCFPLGIFRAHKTAPPLPDCIVYPEPAGEQPFSDRSSGSQAHLASEAGTYRDIRRYSPGDPLSRIDWKAMARFDELYTKEFDGAEGQPALWLRWDDVKASGTEQKLSQLCMWILEAHKKNREFGLEIPGIVIDPSDEEAHMHKCLGVLSIYGEKETGS